MEDGRQATCGERIKKALRIKGMKQSDLCQITKIPKSAISQYISGAFEPKQDRVYLISKALNVSEAWLMGFDVPMEREKNAPEEPKLSEGETKWMELYYRLSDKTREVLITSLDSFDNLTADQQQLALDLLRVALRNKK